MLIVLPPKFRTRRNRRRRRNAPAALTLVSAFYAFDQLVLILVFDRAIDIAAVNVGAFGVFDGISNFRSYVGTGAPTLDDPVTLRLSLMELGATAAGSVTMRVSPENGIVASDDGGAWEGATDIALPFP